MKSNNVFSAIHEYFFSERGPRFRFGPIYATLAAFAVILAAAFFGPNISKGMKADQSGFEVGRVAERDVSADRTVVYVDEDATRLRREAQERLVPAAFRYSPEASKEALAAFSRFAAFSRDQFKKKSSAESYFLAIQAEYPTLFLRETIDALHRSPGRSQLLDAAESALRILMNGGVVSLPVSGLDGFNPDLIEVKRVTVGKNERERISMESVTTLSAAPRKISAIVSNGSFPSALAPIAPALIKPFIKENVTYSAEDSAHRLEEARSRVQPLVKRIERGERVIKKGFIVTKADLERYNALGVTTANRINSKSIGVAILLFLVFAMMLSFLTPRVTGRSLKSSEIYLLAAFSVAYILGAVFAKAFPGASENFPSSIFIPTSLLTMLLAALMGPRVALSFAFFLPTAAFVSGFFNSSAFVFDIVSGVVGAFVLQSAERRMDLIRAGMIIAGVQVVAAVGVLFASSAASVEFAPTIFWAAFNGFTCGMTILGFLPLFEHALDAITPFRLIELSDLNSPALKRLLTTAPGTYSHSVMVANLAESACREIGADALLARVGAYYHDIGKIDQPEYFIENQAAYNKHDDIQPRLSATVIRSHVKLGIEKARKLGLPKEVVDIIAEHHGNSVI
ncbi:MAG: HDIG domain-containing metalloprotein, partial [Treponemataceae bacterium]